jgi:NADH-quinone oxidoreductase subunit A
MLEYANIGIMLAVAAAIAGSVLGISFLVGPRNPNPKKGQPYECGIEDIAPMPSRVSIRFLQVAMLFLIFDVEAVAFYPLATILKETAVLDAQNGTSNGLFLLAEFGTFFALLVVGYLYVWKKGAFRWNS